MRCYIFGANLIHHGFFPRLLSIRFLQGFMSTFKKTLVEILNTHYQPQIINTMNKPVTLKGIHIWCLVLSEKVSARLFESNQWLPKLWKIFLRLTWMWVSISDCMYQISILREDIRCGSYFRISAKTINNISKTWRFKLDIINVVPFQHTQSTGFSEEPR